MVAGFGWWRRGGPSASLHLYKSCYVAKNNYKKQSLTHNNCLLVSGSAMHSSCCAQGRFSGGDGSPSRNMGKLYLPMSRKMLDASCQVTTEAVRATIPNQRNNEKPRAKDGRRRQRRHHPAPGGNQQIDLHMYRSKGKTGE